MLDTEGLKNATLETVDFNSSIIPREISDFPLFGSAEVMYRLFDIIPYLQNLRF